MDEQPNPLPWHGPMGPGIEGVRTWGNAATDGTINANNTDVAQPILAGRGAKGASTMRIQVDDETYDVPVDQNGVWDWASPKGYGDGTHEVTLTPLDGSGSPVGDALSYEVDVAADSGARQRDSLNARQWEQQGRDNFHSEDWEYETFGEPEPEYIDDPRDVGGGATGEDDEPEYREDGEEMTEEEMAELDEMLETTESDVVPPEPITGTRERGEGDDDHDSEGDEPDQTRTRAPFEKGSTVAPDGSLEKGNDGLCAICGEPRGDETPCPHCGME